MIAIDSIDRTHMNMTWRTRAFVCMYESNWESGRRRRAHIPIRNSNNQWHVFKHVTWKRKHVIKVI